MSPGTRRVILVATMFVVGVVMLIGYSGIWDRAMSAGTATLRITPGAFDGLLVVEVQPHWGNYRVLVGRGPRYPMTADAIGEMEGATVEQITAARAVWDGATIYARSFDTDGQVLDFRPVALRPLRTDDEPVEAILPGHSAAHTIELTLDEGP